MADKGKRMKVARLNESGIATFAGWLETVKQGGSVQSPMTMLANLETIEKLGVEVEVAPRSFANRFEAAEYLFNCFTSAGLEDVESDCGLWAWLSLFYFDAVCPAGKSGARKPGARARHISEPGNFQRYYRHLLAGPYRIYRAHRDDPANAMALLCQPLDTPGEVVEQLASRQELVTNKAVIGLATRRYVDTSGKKKRGVEGKGYGSLRRLSTVLDQFDLTWDLYAATPGELAAVMPREFSKFLA
ncbi:MAG: hypothetical protein ABIQ35_03565 [Verrucomicrobiota bacterium]